MSDIHKKNIVNRPKRVPLHRQNVLNFEGRKGFVRRMVNERPGRVEAFERAGWAIVKEDSADQNDARAQTASTMGSVIRKVVNSDPQASAQTAVLMEIREELYEEDQASKQLEIKKREANFDPNVAKQHGADYGVMEKT